MSTSTPVSSSSTGDKHKEAKSTVLSIEEEATMVAIPLPCRRYSPNGFARSPERHTGGR